jgi:hypothetical protein
MKSLTSLNLRDSKVSTAAIQRLQAQRPDLKIDHSVVRDSRHFAVVREITKRGGQLDVIDGSASVTFDGNRIANEWAGFDWSRLRDLPRLMAIHLSTFEHADEVLSQLSHFTDLRVLLLDNYAISPELMEQITQCTRLERLALHNCELNPTDFQTIKELTKLETLSISSAKIGPSELSAIASLPKLAELRLEYCEFEQGVFGSIEPPSQWVKLGVFRQSDRCGHRRHRPFQEPQDVDLFLNPAISDASIDKLLAMPLLERVGGNERHPEGQLA